MYRQYRNLDPTTTAIHDVRPQINLDLPSEPIPSARRLTVETYMAIGEGQIVLCRPEGLGLVFCLGMVRLTVAQGS